MLTILHLENTLEWELVLDAANHAIRRMETGPTHSLTSGGEGDWKWNQQPMVNQ